MQAVATALTRVVGRVVQDQSHVIGNVDLHLQWTDALTPAPDTGRPETPSSIDAPSIFTALREQLGLKLESTKCSVEHLDPHLGGCVLHVPAFLPRCRAAGCVRLCHSDVIFEACLWIR